MLPVVVSPRIPPSKEVAGKLSKLYGSPIGPLGGADGPQYGGHAVRRSHTPRSARAPVATWWDAPIAPAPQPASQPVSEGLDSSTPARFQHRVEQPAMAYQASMLEERMLLAAFKRRRNELAESPVDRARSTLSSRGYMSSRGSAMSSQRGATAEKNFWPPERTDPWSVAVEDHNLELRAQHQASLEDFSRSNTAVQEWLVDKQAELRKPTGQGRDQMDRVMFFLATGREAVQKAGSGEASLADIKDAFENQKARRRINSRWAKAIEASHKDLQWISKYRQRDVARQRAQAGSQRVVPLRAGGEVPAARGSGAALPRSGSTQSLKAAAEAGPHSEKLGDEGKQDLPKGADSAAATQPAADDTTDSVSPTPTPPQQQMAQPDGTEVSEGLQQPAAPSYMASNESWRRRNDGFCRGRALREQLASR